MVGGGRGDFHFVSSMMKSAAYYVLCRGTNQFVLHSSVHQPVEQQPDWTHGLNGFNFQRGNTWWHYAGYIYDVEDYEESDTHTHIQIEVEDQGSRIIVFWEKPVGRKLPSWKAEKIIPMSGPWEITFETDRGAPEKIQMDNLASWTEHRDFGVRHFSGVGTYTKTLYITDEFLKESE